MRACARRARDARCAFAFARVHRARRTRVSRASRAHARAPWFFTADAHRARGAPTVASRAARDGAFAPGRWFFTAAERALDALDRDEDRARSEAAYLEWDPADERAAFERASETNGTVRVRAFGPWRSLRFNDVEQGLAYVVEGEGEEARADASALPFEYCLLYTSPSPRDKRQSRMPSSA